MKVILLAEVPKVGRKGEIREVSPGFARNFLFPKKLAAIASQHNIELAKSRELKKEKSQQKKEKEMSLALEKTKGLKLSFIRKSNKEGHLFAGLHEDDIIKEIENKTGLRLKKENILLESPIKKAGLSKIVIRHGKEKGTEIDINIKSE